MRIKPDTEAQSWWVAEKSVRRPQIPLAAFGHMACLSTFKKCCVGMEMKLDAVGDGGGGKKRSSPLILPLAFGHMTCLSALQEMSRQNRTKARHGSHGGRSERPSGRHLCFRNSLHAGAHGAPSAARRAICMDPAARRLAESNHCISSERKSSGESCCKYGRSAAKSASAARSASSVGTSAS